MAASLARSDAHVPRFSNRHIWASVLISISGLLFGLDTGTIGSITAMPGFLKTFGPFSSTIHGLIISSILIPAAIASFFAGYLADHFGRPYGVMFGSILFGIGAALEAGSAELGMLIAGRLITGVGEGLFLSTATVYICEISPSSRRGPLASLPQFHTSLGICVGFFICYGSVKVPSSLSWRLPFILQTCIAVILAVSCLFLPSSPRWLIARGRSEDVPGVLQKLGIPIEMFEKELAKSPIRSRTSQQSFLHTSSCAQDQAPDIVYAAEEKRSLRLLAVFEKQCRRQSFFAMFLMGMQQLAGIDGVLYYAPVLFRQAGLSSSESSFLASGVTGLLMFLVTIPAAIFSDHWPRRSSTIAGGVVLSTCMILIGSLYASNDVHANGVARWVVIVAIYIFAISYNATWAVTFKIYSAEIQPASTRAAATSLSLTANWTANWIVAFTTPIFLAYSSCGAYYLFGGFALFTLIICLIYMPETRGKSLEETEYLFQTRSSGALSKFICEAGKFLRRTRHSPTDN